MSNGRAVARKHHESKKEDPYCEHCGKTITDFSKTKVYRSGGPYYETVYICYDCLYPNKENEDGR